MLPQEYFGSSSVLRRSLVCSQFIAQLEVLFNVCLSIIFLRNRLTVSQGMIGLLVQG